MAPSTSGYDKAFLSNNINITDAIFLGHGGEIELGASALAGIWYLTIYMLGFGFQFGVASGNCTA